MNIQEMKQNAMNGVWTISDTLAVLDDLQRLQSLTQWVLVTERLPDREIGVLINEIDLGVIVARIQKNYDIKYKFWTGYDTHGNGGILCEATHWMPLPLPPEGVK